MLEITFKHPEAGKLNDKINSACLDEFITINTVHNGIISIKLKSGVVFTAAVIKATNADGKELTLKEIEKALQNKGEN